jgi:alpha-glucosidase
LNNIDWKETIYSDTSINFIHPFNPKIRDIVQIRLRVFKKNPIKSIYIRIAPEGEEINIPLENVLEEDFFQYFECKIKFIAKLMYYRFRIITTDKQNYWFNTNGLITWTPLDYHDFKIIANFEDPTWVKDAIFYQIFPDRFYDGNPTNNVKTGEYKVHNISTRMKKWDELPESQSGYPFLDFWGGDLEGIKQKIPYLKQLGITALYLNPIFHALSNHKYDTIDYKKIDPHFGTNEEFAELVKELHNNDIRIILDGVFNHSGEGHYWFNRLGLFKEDGAYNSPNSPYREYYTFNDENPDNYQSWLGYKSLPKLNYQSQGLRKEIYDSSDAIIKYWLNPPYNIDGWRIDVANMIGRQKEFQLFKKIWSNIRKAVKNDKKDAYLMGEHFFDPTELLDGTNLDAVMNYYGFYHPFLRWMTQCESISISDSNNKLFRKSVDSKFSAYDMHLQLKEFRSCVPFQIQLLNFNLLDCHDLPRFFTLVKKDIMKFKIGIIFLFTYIGVPSIYYGDEIGMEGGKDPDCRRAMLWDTSRWNNEILSFYKLMINLRLHSPELQFGSLRVLEVNHDFFIFTRFIPNRITIVVLSKSVDDKEVSVPLWKIGIENTSLNEVIRNQVYNVENGLLHFILKENEGKIFQLS